MHRRSVLLSTTDNSSEVPLFDLSCSHVLTQPQSCIVYELSMRRFALYLPSSTSIQIHSAKNSGLTRVKRRRRRRRGGREAGREKEGWYWNSIRLGISEVYTHTTDSTMASHVQYIGLYHSLKGRTNVSIWHSCIRERVKEFYSVTTCHENAENR